MTAPNFSQQVAAEVRGVIAAKLGFKSAPSVLLAEVLECTPATAAKRLDGTTPLDVLELMKIATWLEVELTDLLPGQSQTAAAS